LAFWAGRRLAQSFEPGEDCVSDHRANQFVDVPGLIAPASHPAEQPAPGPAAIGFADWQRHLH